MVEIVKEKIKEIVNELRVVVEKEVPREMVREVVVNETRVERVEVPGEVRIVENNNTSVEVKVDTNYIEKVV